VSAATDHLPRLLALVPWLLGHPDTPIDEVAAVFGVTPEQVRADLDLIWMCGLPGHGPGDLIDVFVTADRVTLANADTIAAPLRLSPSETVAVVAALRALSALPGIADSGAVERALAKLEASAGSSAAGIDRVAVAGAADGGAGGEAGPGARQVADRVREALTSGRRLHIDYWVPARDEVTSRDVDPIRIRTADSATYLIGWCRRVDDLRTFRLDRILEARVLDQPADPPADAAAGAPDSSLFTPAPDDRAVTFALQPAGRWVIDYYPVEAVEEHADGIATVTLKARDEEWVRRLALALGGAGRLLDPPDLVDAVQVAARAALAAYDAG
jgi:proteasome accessory factor C